MKQETNTVEDLARREYKYGFITDIEADTVPPGLDEEIIRFLGAGEGGGVDQPSATAFRTIVELFDREWLSRMGETAHAMA